MSLSPHLFFPSLLTGQCPPPSPPRGGRDPYTILVSPPKKRRAVNFCDWIFGGIRAICAMPLLRYVSSSRDEEGGGKSFCDFISLLRRSFCGGGEANSRSESQSHNCEFFSAGENVRENLRRNPLLSFFCSQSSALHRGSEIGRGRGRK